MNKKIMTAAGTVLALFIAMDYALHCVLLRGLYEQTAFLWRSSEEMAGLTWIFFVVDALMAFLFAWLFSKGWEEGKPWLGQGVRFGLVLGLLFSLPMGFSMYVVMPIPFNLALGWFAGVLVEFMIAGIAAARVFGK